MSTLTDPPDPILAAWPRGERGELRLTYQLDGNSRRITVREWMLVNDGSWIPTRHGVQIYRRELVMLAEALLREAGVIMFRDRRAQS